MTNPANSTTSKPITPITRGRLLDEEFGALRGSATQIATCRRTSSSPVFQELPWIPSSADQLAQLQFDAAVAELQAESNAKRAESNAKRAEAAVRESVVLETAATSRRHPTVDVGNTGASPTILSIRSQGGSRSGSGSSDCHRSPRSTEFAEPSNRPSPVDPR